MTVIVSPVSGVMVVLRKDRQRQVPFTHGGSWGDVCDLQSEENPPSSDIIEVQVLNACADYLPHTYQTILISSYQWTTYGTGRCRLKAVSYRSNLFAPKS